MITGIHIWRDTKGWSTRKTYRSIGSTASYEMTGGSFLDAVKSIVIPNAYYVWRYQRRQALRGEQ